MEILAREYKMVVPSGAFVNLAQLVFPPGPGAFLKKVVPGLPGPKFTPWALCLKWNPWSFFPCLPTRLKAQTLFLGRFDLNFNPTPVRPLNEAKFRPTSLWSTPLERLAPINPTGFYGTRTCTERSAADLRTRRRLAWLRSAYSDTIYVP